MVTVSDMFPNSLHILWNSDAGRLTIELYSVSGIPSYSLSNVIKLKLNSESLSYLLLSNINLIDVGSSSACKVMISSDDAHFNIFARFSILTPRVIGLSHL